MALLSASTHPLNPAWAGTLQDVVQRGVLKCGVSDGTPGFSFKSADGVYGGMDVDFCKAVAAAVLGDPNKLKLVPTTTADRFKHVTDGSVDVLARNTTWTMQRELEEGVLFPAIFYFDGQGFLVPRELGLTKPAQLSGAKVCVLSDTTSETNAAAFFAASGLQVELVKLPNLQDVRAAYESGSCDALTSDRAALYGEMQLLSDPSKHMVLTDVISKEPLSPVVRASDRIWADIIRWVLACLINAEEVNLTKQDVASGAPLAAVAQARFVTEAGNLGTKLGLAPKWVGAVIRAVGNYGEMFDRNLGKASPLGMARGKNALWKDGGLLFAPPMP